MQLYKGAAFLTVATSGATGGVIVTSGAADSHGWWPAPLTAQGNDARSAANLMAAVEAVTDRSNWIGWRIADWIAGGDYSALFTGTVQMGGILVYKGALAAVMITGGATLYVGDTLAGTGGNLVVTTGGAVNCQSGSTFTMGGIGLSTGAWGWQGSQSLQGTGAFTNYRIAAGPDATTTITPTDQDTWIIPVLGADRIWTLADPAAGHLNTRFRIRQLRDPVTQAHDLTVKTSGGVTRCIIGHAGFNNPAVVDFEWDPVDGSWMIVSVWNASINVGSTT